MELKWLSADELKKSNKCSNRTFMELKLAGVAGAGMAFKF